MEGAGRSRRRHEASPPSTSGCRRRLTGGRAAGGVPRGGAARPCAARPARAASPEAMARARGDAREGLDWLGRPAGGPGDPAYRPPVLVARLHPVRAVPVPGSCRGPRERPADAGRLHPARRRHTAAGWIRSSSSTRCRLAPRAWFLGSAPSAFSSRWREWLIRRVGGLLPVWRGGVGIEQHVRVGPGRARCRWRLRPDAGGTVSRARRDRIGPFRTGAALIALRTGAPIVPFAMAGTDELYLGRRMASRVLPVTSIARAARPDLDGVVPARGEPGRDRARPARRSEALAERLGAGRRGAPALDVDPPGHPRRLRRRLTWLLLAPGRLDR